MDMDIAYSELIANGDYPQIVARLTKSYGGDGTHTYANLIITAPDGSVVTKPPEQAFVDAWNAYQTRQALKNDQLNNLIAQYQGHVAGKPVTSLDLTGLRLLLLAIGYKLGAVDKDDLTGAPLSDWINT